MNDNNNTLVGILAYITLLGFIIALIINSNKEGKEREFGAFHLRQALGLGILHLIILFSFQIISFIIGINFAGNLLSLSVLILAVLGVINAANGEMKELPLIGSFINEKLGKTFE